MSIDLNDFTFISLSIFSSYVNITINHLLIYQHLFINSSSIYSILSVFIIRHLPTRHLSVLSSRHPLVHKLIYQFDLFTSLEMLVGSQPANLASPLLYSWNPQGHTRDHPSRDDSHTAGGDGKGGQEKRRHCVNSSRSSLLPLSPRVAPTFCGVQEPTPHTDLSPHWVWAISNQIVLFSSEKLTSHRGLTLQWGQFIDHDLDFTPEPPARVAFTVGVDCERTCTQLPPCFPIKLPPASPPGPKCGPHPRP